MTGYTIEHAIPMPPKKGGHSPTGWFGMALRQMAVGDSIMVPTTGKLALRPGTISSLMHWNGRKMGRTFAQRKNGRGTRIWRTA